MIYGDDTVEVEMDTSAFDEARNRWLSFIVSKFATPRNDDSRVSELSATELALIDIHVGFSHLMGADRDEAALGEFCSPDHADSLVRRWRAGRIPTHIAGEPKAVWTSLWRVGLWAGAVRPEISTAIGASFLAKTTKTEPPSPDQLRKLWAQIPEPKEPRAAPWDEVWDCDGSHLTRLADLYDVPRPALMALTPLEARAIAGARRDSRLEERLDRALRRIDVIFAAPGGWGGPRPTDVPEWVRDYSIARGGRVRQARAGIVPCWYVVAESVEELRAISAWRHGDGEIAVATELDGDPGVALLRLTLDFSDGRNPGVLDFRYNTAHWEDSASLDALAWTERARMEVYTSSNGTLEYAFAMGVPLPGGRRALTDPRVRLFPEEDNWLEALAPSKEDVLYQMRNAERVQFELVRRGEAARRTDSMAAAQAFESYLRAIDGAARASRAGMPPDMGLVDRIKREVQTELSVVGDLVPDIALASLQPNQAFMQVHVTTSEPLRYRANLARHDGSEHHALSVTLAEVDYTTGRIAPDDDGLESLAQFGAESLVLSASGPLYAKPIHEDFLDEGFTQVSYAHRSTAIGPYTPLLPELPDVLLAGWAGDPGSADHLSFLDREFAAIERAYNCTRKPLTWDVPLPTVVHLAGHGMSGHGASDHWLQAAQSIDDLVTPARVLLNLDASNTELVYLSACASGRGEFGVRNVMEAIPLDVAFLERGATCVVSTGAPVNDIVAALFAIAFHTTWRAGASLWDAYAEARSLTSTARASSNVTEAVDLVWPTWQADLDKASAAHPDDWMQFRLSGRHW